MVKIKFFPHSTSLDNEAGISTGSAEVDLSPLGRHQASTLKEKIKDEKFDKVFSSDLKRALETANVALGYKYEIIIDKRLREIDIGDLTGRDDSFTEPLAYKYIDVPFPNGESFQEVESRLRNFLEEVASIPASECIAILPIKHLN